MSDCDRCRFDPSCGSYYPDRPTINGKPNQTYGVLGKVLYCRPQVIMLIPLIHDLMEGMNPPQVTNVICHKPNNQVAPYWNACEISAELRTRLDKCWLSNVGYLDRNLVTDNYCLNYSTEVLGVKYGFSEDEISNRINRAVNYIASGPVQRWVDTEARRGMSYSDWCAHRTEVGIKSKYFMQHPRRHGKKFVPAHPK